ncbi:MAG: T9SS type A sorting domain-containing protein [bacterium]
MKRASCLFFILFSVKLVAGIGVGYSTSGAIPVELTAFSAVVYNDNVVLNWTTSTEVNNYGFEVERSIYNKDYSNIHWTKIGFVEGEGTSTIVKNYYFKDTKPFKEKSVYRLKQIDINGSFKYSSIIEVELVFLSDYSLRQNYPNPFNPSTTISYSLPVASKITLTVYDVLGNQISILVDEIQSAGSYSINFNAAELSSGIYFYKIQASNFSDIKKMLLIK